jgi:hypothetical protein
VDAGEPLLLGESGEVPLVLFHVRAEAPPEGARFVDRERLAVNDDRERSALPAARIARIGHQEEVSCAISLA